MKKFFFLPIFLLIIYCAKNKATTIVVEDTFQHENIEQIKSIEGIIIEIQFGKDGYTAKLKTNSNEIYFATISRVNLKNADEYKTFAIGEELKVIGDFWQMEYENHITVREIL